MAQNSMRQTDHVVTLPEGVRHSGRKPAPFSPGKPFVARSGDGSPMVAVVNDGRLMLMCSNTRNPNCTIIPLSQYLGISITKHGGMYVVALYHENPDLQLEIALQTHLAQALKLRTRLARQWRLPEAYVTADGTVHGLSMGFGSLAAFHPSNRRNGALRRSRPRFLVKRKTGSGRGARRPGREIIART